MADEPMSPGEIQRALERHDRALMNAVTTDAWVRENEHLRNEIREAVNDCRERTDDVEKAAMEAVKELKENKQNAWMRILGVLGVAATLIAAALAAYMSSRGAH